MKTLLSISIMLFISTAIVGIVVDALGIVECQICLTDIPDEGNSEKEISENGEEDSEKDSFDPSEYLSLSYLKAELYGSAIQSIIGHCLEIPSPPPRS